MLNRITAPLLAATLLAAPALAETFSAGQKAEIDAQVRAYLLENPEVILEAMQVYEERQKAAEAEGDRALIAGLSDEIFNDGYSFVGGNPDGDVTLVEFTDYRCGYCKRAHDEVKALLEAEPNLRLVVKELPILGPESTFAARAAMAAQEQGDALYAAFNDAMMRHEGQLDQPTVVEIARKIGLDEAQLRADIDATEITENIQTTYALARKLGINGTPGFIIGDQIVRGYVPYETLRGMVAEARTGG